jgi:hypothetical protein
MPAYYGKPHWTPQDIGYLHDLIDGIARGDVLLDAISTNGGIDVERIVLEMTVLRRSLVNFQVQAQAAATQFQAMSQTFTRALNIHMPGDDNLEDLGTSITPIVGYRDFGIKHGGVLVSRNGVVWPYGRPLVATCHPRSQPKKHIAPKIGCSCGIYAFDSPDHHDLEMASEVWGEVYLWGDVLICESGYRAQFAYPKTLFIRSNHYHSDVAKELENLYRVPVIKVNERTGQTAGDILMQLITAGKNPDLTFMDEGGES